MKRVSIHAPTQGATLTPHPKFVTYPCFNPRTHTGCDFCYFLFFRFIAMFQSTHPHRVRHEVSGYIGISLRVSIHAPTQGATFNSHIKEAHPKSFNPRTHTGCDLLLSTFSLTSIVSIHAPTQGATTYLLQ